VNQSIAKTKSHVLDMCGLVFLMFYNKPANKLKDSAEGFIHRFAERRSQNSVVGRESIGGIASGKDLGQFSRRRCLFGARAEGHTRFECRFCGHWA
jgi:hypothetical protein